MIGSDYHSGLGILHLSRISMNYNPAAEERLDTVVLTTIAHLLGQQMGRNAFNRPSVVNKDMPATGTGKDQGNLSDVPRDACPPILRPPARGFDHPSIEPLPRADRVCGVNHR